MTVRIAHLSDLHYHVPPTAREALSKRALGLMNLYVKGRVNHFSASVASKAIQAVREIKPDGVAITGDLTALATEDEFRLARAGLDSLLHELPTVIIPGNHDYYTRGSKASDRIERSFGDWMRGIGQAQGEPVEYPTVHRIGDATLIGLNPCRPGVGSSGLVLPEQIARLEALLAMPRRAGEVRVLMIHYPLMGMNGEAVTRWTRRLNNREGLLALLKRQPVEIVIHGHDHMRYHNRIACDDGRTIYVANSGSSAFAPREGLPVPASFNVYLLGDGELKKVSHYDLVNDAFELTYEGTAPPTGPSYNRVGDPTYVGESAAL